jgi:hypothetical protein
MYFAGMGREFSNLLLIVDFPAPSGPVSAIVIIAVSSLCYE